MALYGLQRVRVFTAEYGRPLGILLFVLAILVLVSGLFLYISPPTETVTTETNQQTIEASQDVSVTVTNTTEAYEEGTVLENQPVYLTPAGSEATVNIGLDGPPNTEAAVTTVVRYEATYEDETEPFYTSETMLDQTTVSTDENASVTVDTERIRGRSTSLQNEFGRNVEVTAEVVTLVGYDTGAYTGTLEVASEASFPTTGTYRLQPADNQVLRVTEEEVTQVDKSRTIATTDIRTNLVSSVILALVIALAGEFARRTHTNLSVEEERATLEAERYNEFITSMEGPLSCPRPTEYVQSIRELVKYSKTTGEQVLHCQTTSVYVVVDGDRVIMYDPKRNARASGMAPDITFGNDESGDGIERLGLLDSAENIEEGDASGQGTLDIRDDGSTIDGDEDSSRSNDEDDGSDEDNEDDDSNGE